MAVNRIINHRETPPRLRVVGNRIVDPGGKPRVLNGLNIGDIVELKQEGHLSEEYFRKMAEWGAQVVRIPIHPGNYREYGQEQTFTLIDRAVEWSKINGMYVIIDWHSIGNMINGNFLSPSNIYYTTKEETKAFWRSVAERYKNEPAVAFYEIFNEPAACSSLLWDRLTWTAWRDTADEVIDVIYANNPKAIPIVSGISFASDMHSYIEAPLRNKGIVLGAHPYPGSISEPWEVNWEKHFGYLSENYPIMLTEVGFDPNDTFVPEVYKAGVDYGFRIINYAKVRNISWIAFVFYKGQYWPMPLFQNWQTFEPTESGTFFRNALLNSLE
jgi:hypothetical protein